MPAKSAAQYRFMVGIEHGMKPKNKLKGPSKKVAKEFVDATPINQRKKFMRGGK